MVDETKLNAFIGKMLGDLGGAFSVPMVHMGDKLGFYTALKEQGYDAERTGGEDEGGGALCARMAVAPGGLRLSRIRRGLGPVRLAS